MRKLAFAIMAAGWLASCATTAPNASLDTPQAYQSAAQTWIGRWEVAHTDGTAFQISLNADGTAVSTWGTGETGVWRVDGTDAVQVLWTDGWTDIIYAKPGGFEKIAFAPGVAIHGKPSN